MILDIFPEGGLASSVITTVWIGVLILCFFNLRFGWVLSGLVVPGYIVPLLVVKPLAAAVIVVEAILAYAIVWVFSEKLAPGRWPALFGRDRFMGLILSSIAVRLTMDGLLLPQLGEWLATNYNQRLDWQSDLQSFGLVIISLMANQFWKPGLARGLFSLVVVTGLTFLVVRYGLMEFTNFRLSAVTYMYEGLASSILASPKAYMILVLTALYASHMNVRYGWDFSGILIPALIALQWYQPTKILTSFVEAAVIYFIARQLLKTPWLQNATIEGANKMLLFFNVSFVFKLALGHALVWLAWDVKTTDFYGFGYLLSTLLAIKAHDKNIFPRLMRSTLQVSAVGAIAGNLAGIAVALILPANAAQASTTQRAVAQREQDLLVRAIGDARLKAVAAHDSALDREAAAALADAIELLEADAPLLAAGLAGKAGGWLSESLPDGRIALQRADGKGEDLLIFNGAAQADLAVLLPDPGAAPGLGLAGARLAQDLDARWLVISAPQPAEASTGQTVDALFRAKWSGPLLEVSASSAATPRLSLADSSATAIAIGDLRARLPDIEIGLAGLRGGSVADGEAAASLALSNAAIDALLPPAGARVSEARRACGRLPGAVGSMPVATASQRVFLREEVVAPLLAARSTSDPLLPARAGVQALGMRIEACDAASGPLLALVGSPAQGRAYFDPAGRDDRIVMGAMRSEIQGGDGTVAPLAGGLRSTAFSVAASATAGLLVLAPRELDFDGEQETVFGTITQAAIDRLGNEPGLVLQLRSYPADDLAGLAGGRVVVAPDRIGTDTGASGDALEILRRAGLDPVLAARTREWAGFEVFPQTALLYLNHSLNKRFAVLYVPPRAAAR